MEQLGFVQGSFSPCAYYHPIRGICYLVHGDGFVGVGARKHLEWVRGCLGPAHTDNKEIRILNRVLTWVDGVDGKPDTVWWEADQRHVQILCQQLGLRTGHNTRVTPCDRTRLTKAPPLTGDDLPQEQSRTFSKRDDAGQLLGGRPARHPIHF